MRTQAKKLLGPVVSILAASFIDHFVVRTLLIATAILLLVYGYVPWHRRGVRMLTIIICVAAILAATGVLSYLALEKDILTVSSLERIADQDEQAISDRIHLVMSAVQAKPNLEAPEPYIDLEFPLLNVSVFSLTFERSEGRVRYNGYPLQWPPEPTESSFSFNHGQYGVLVLRQSVSRDVAREMLDTPPVRLDSGRFAIWFSYKDRHGVRKEARKAFPSQLFTIN